MGNKKQTSSALGEGDLEESSFFIRVQNYVPVKYDTDLSYNLNTEVLLFAIHNIMKYLIVNVKLIVKACNIGN